MAPCCTIVGNRSFNDGALDVVTAVAFVRSATAEPDTGVLHADNKHTPTSNPPKDLIPP
ncbi:hypothetical protein AB0H12_42195 [Actinosynnema sp. NPDC023794]